MPFARQGSWPPTSKVVNEALVAVRSPLTTTLPVVVTFPWRLMVKTGVLVSLIPRMRKSFWFEVPCERTSSVERVPVAEVLEVWLRVKTEDVPNAEDEAYMPCNRSALKAYGDALRRLRGVISASTPMVTPK